MPVTITHYGTRKLRAVRAVGTTETSYHINLRCGAADWAVVENLTAHNRGLVLDKTGLESGWARITSLSAGDEVIVIAGVRG